jgi:hypothetical protein
VKKQAIESTVIAGLAAVATVCAIAAPAAAHHSYAMFDQTKTVTLTGVMYQFVGQAAHSELHMYLIGNDGKLEKSSGGENVAYLVELDNSATAALQGISAETFPAGTIFSIKVNPTRDGRNFGSRVRGIAIAKCPWKTPPGPGRTCDSVSGRELIGGTTF